MIAISHRKLRICKRAMQVQCLVFSASASRKTSLRHHTTLRCYTTPFESTAKRCQDNWSCLHGTTCNRSTKVTYLGSSYSVLSVASSWRDHQPESSGASEKTPQLYFLLVLQCLILLDKYQLEEEGRIHCNDVSGSQYNKHRGCVGWDICVGQYQLVRLTPIPQESVVATNLSTEPSTAFQSQTVHMERIRLVS